MNIPIIKPILEESDALGRSNKELFDKHNVFTVNLMSSPGSGKTALLEVTIPKLVELKKNSAVIQGDITSTLDSERMAHLGIQVVQANTEPFGGDCHIGSHLIRSAVDHFDLDSLDFLFIENVGNLVCPAEFYLGEHLRTVVLSLTEGAEKPLKYPLMFRECNVCLINKIDLAPHLDVKVDDVITNIRKINANMDIFPISSKTGEGINLWIEYLLNK